MSYRNFFLVIVGGVITIFMDISQWLKVAIKVRLTPAYNVFHFSWYSLSHFKHNKEERNHIETLA
jgi:hypothetical protein